MWRNCGLFFAGFATWFLPAQRHAIDLRIDGPDMHARGLSRDGERIVLVGDHYTATDTRTGVLTCPVELDTPVYDLLERKAVGNLTPADPSITLRIQGLNDRARFLYIGHRWDRRVPDGI